MLHNTALLVVLCTQGVCCTILHYWWYSVHRECAAQYCTIGGTLYTGSVLHNTALLVVLCTQGMCCTILHYWWYSVHRECAAQYCTIGGTLYTGNVLHKSLVGAEALNNTVLTCIAVYLAFDPNPSLN